MTIVRDFFDGPALPVPIACDAGVKLKEGHTDFWG